jgi:hypothetical protein
MILMKIEPPAAGAAGALPPVNPRAPR